MFLISLLLSFFIICTCSLASAGFKQDVYQILHYPSEPKLRGEIWYGKASWYGKKFHGRKTSNGEKYNKNELTAAHKTLPFNTKVKVTNLKNNKSVIVRVNDRGPFKPGRIIDLSEKAAEVIESKEQGIADVKLRVLSEIQ